MPKDIKDIIDLTISWEKKLKDFYDVAELALKERKSKRTVDILRRNILKNIELLQDIDFKAYGHPEWVKFIPQYKEDELLPVKKITREATPEQILGEITKYEEQLRDFYIDVRDKLVSPSWRELFSSLVQIKVNQLADIKRFMGEHDLSL